MERNLFNIKINTKFEYKVFAPNDAMAIETALYDFIKNSNDPIKNIQCKEIKGKLLEDKCYEAKEEAYSSIDFDEMIEVANMLFQTVNF